MRYSIASRSLVAPPLLVIVVVIVGGLLTSLVAAESVNVAIGQLFEVPLADGDRIDERMLPDWIGYSGDDRVLFGVPRWPNFENVTLRTTNGAQIDINVTPELKVCDDDRDYVFVEHYHDKEANAFRVADLRYARDCCAASKFAHSSALK